MINLENFRHESLEEGKAHKVNTTNIYHCSFKPSKGEGKFREFSFIVDKDGKRVGLTFTRTGNRMIQYNFIVGEGLFMGRNARKVNKGTVLTAEMNTWLYRVLDDSNTFKYNPEEWDEE